LWDSRISTPTATGSCAILASTDAILTDLHDILLAHYRLNMRYEKNDVIKDALVN